VSIAADRIPLHIKLAHGLGSMAYGVKDNGFSTFLLIFYSQVIGLDARLVSLALMLALIVDAFADPVIGHLSDRTYTRWGRRHPWLYLAAIPLGFAWMLLWSPPEDKTYIFAYLVVVAILVRTLISCCEVPSQSLVAELTHDYDERTSLTRFRFLFAWGGGLLVFFLANAVFLRSDETHKFGQLNPEGYWNYGLAGAVLMAASVIVSALGQHKRVAHWPADKPDSTTIGQALTEIMESLRHPAALILLGATAIAISSTQMTFTLSNFLYLYVWQFSEGNFAWLPWLLFGSVVAAFLAVAPLHRRFGKKRSAIVAGVLSTGFWLTPYTLRLAGVWPPEGSAASSNLLFAFMLVSNVNAVIVTISAQSMLADVVEASYEQTGRRTEGVFAAGWMFVQKCATAVGIGLSGVLISWSGLPRKAVPGQVDVAVIDRLTTAYGAIVLVALIASTLLFRRFPITREDHETRVAALAARNAAARANGD
jgi:GPH family glycoside/pentoside/hexuronide:cation symporter